MTCQHPIDSVATLDVVSSHRKIELVRWCARCGAISARQDTSDLRKAAEAPWSEWHLPTVSKQKVSQ